MADKIILFLSLQCYVPSEYPFVLDIAAQISQSNYRAVVMDDVCLSEKQLLTKIISIYLIRLGE